VKKLTEAEQERYDLQNDKELRKKLDKIKKDRDPKNRIDVEQFFKRK
jgi:hypothetical protein